MEGRGRVGTWLLAPEEGRCDQRRTQDGKVRFVIFMNFWSTKKMSSDRGCDAS